MGGGNGFASLVSNDSSSGTAALGAGGGGGGSGGSGFNTPRGSSRRRFARDTVNDGYRAKKIDTAQKKAAFKIIAKDRAEANADLREILEGQENAATPKRVQLAEEIVMTLCD